MLIGRPSLLAVAPVAPWPVRDGLSLRIARLLEHLAGEWSIALVCPSPADASVIPAGIAYAGGTPAPIGATYPWRVDPTALRAAVAAALRTRSPDRALLWPGAELLGSMPGMPPALADLVDCNALEFWREMPTARGWRAAAQTARELALAVRDGARAGRRVRAVMVVGEVDAAWQRRIGGSAAVHVVPNGVALPDPGGAECATPTLAFTGTLDYPPNVDAVLWAASAIWPLVRSSVPDARFIVAGRRPVPGVRALNGGGIEVWPDVADMAVVLGGAWVSVAPMRRGVGIKNKVLESWASGRPAVLTPLAVNGLALPPGHAALVARSADALAAAICRLLHSPRERHALGAAARDHVAAHFSWAGAAARLDTLLRAIE